MRLRLLVPGRGRGRGLGRLRALAACAAALLVLAVAGCGGDDGEPERPRATPTPTAEATATPTPGTAVIEPEGELAVGITEPNPNFLWPPPRQVPLEFDPGRDALTRMRPAYYRLVIDWPSLQPSASSAPNLDKPEIGCMRDVKPCAGWLGVRDQLKALAARQKGDQGAWQVLVVLTGTPDWAARPPSGCERAGTEPRSRPPRSDALPAYQRLVATLIAAADRAGAELRYWSAWNEPNHPFFISPQRERCSRTSPTLAVAPYVELAEALRAELDRAAGDQRYVLGELAGLDDRRPRSTAIGEFIRALPRELVCGTTVWSQHGYVGGPDPVDDAARALSRFDCRRSHEIWITETGVGGTTLGSGRATSGEDQRRACRAMRRRLRRWYEDPRVTAAYQYTLREDDRFPTGLFTTDLSDSYPVLREWEAWGTAKRPRATDPPPASACS